MIVEMVVMKLPAFVGNVKKIVNSNAKMSSAFLFLSDVICSQIVMIKVMKAFLVPEESVI